MTPVKIALYGPAGSGKDYVAKHLIDELALQGTDIVRFAFADKVKETVNNILGFNDYQKKMSVESEDFKSRVFIDLDSLESGWLSEVPKDTTCQGEFLQTTHKIRYDKNFGSPFVVYTAKDLFELLQRVQSSQDRQVIPNVMQSLAFESIEYPEGYNKETQFYRLMSYREFVVWFGTYCCQNLLGKRIWVNSMMNDEKYIKTITKDNSGVIITDLRFPHEYDACRENGFKIIKIEAEKKEVEVSNIAEEHYGKFDPDFVFFNSRDKETFDSEMRKCIDFIYDR